MARSARKTLAIPHPIRDALNNQLEEGVMDYPSENAMWLGLGAYQLMVGKSHPITEAFARMHADDQDVIYDFLKYKSDRGETLKGSFLKQVITSVVDGLDDPTEQDVNELLPAEVLRMAKEWRDCN